MADLNKNEEAQQILVEFLNTKFHANQFCGSRVVLRVQTNGFNTYIKTSTSSSELPNACKKRAITQRMICRCTDHKPTKADAIIL